MSFYSLAKEWLIAHDHHETDASFEDDIESLASLLEEVNNDLYANEEQYNPSIGSETLCLCGHTYYRHFDPYENMAPVGCKYCSHSGDHHNTYCCPGFEAK